MKVKEENIGWFLGSLAQLSEFSVIEANKSSCVTLVLLEFDFNT